MLALTHFCGVSTSYAFGWKSHQNDTKSVIIILTLIITLTISMAQQDT